MSSPLESTLATVVMCYFEKFWLENCPTHFKSVVSRRYMEDTFLLFRSIEHVEKFNKHQII